MAETTDYSRVYHSIIDDERFARVYDDDRALAAWLRLLLVADQAWPASAHVPAGTNRKALVILTDSGLVELQRGGRYRIHGLSAERERRAREQRNGGNVRAETGERGPDGRYLKRPAVVASGGPAVVASGGDQRDQLRRDETRRDETSATARGSGSSDPYDEAVAWLASRKAWLGDSVKLSTELARMVDKRGAEAVIAAMDAVPDAETAAQFVYGARNALFPLSGSQVLKPLSAAEALRAEGDRLLAERAARRAQS